MEAREQNFHDHGTADFPAPLQRRTDDGSEGLINEIKRLESRPCNFRAPRDQTKSTIVHIRPSVG